jgi:hypothetical protein
LLDSEQQTATESLVIILVLGFYVSAFAIIITSLGLVVSQAIASLKWSTNECLVSKLDAFINSLVIVLITNKFEIVLFPTVKIVIVIVTGHKCINR